MEHGNVPRWFKPEGVVFPKINTGEKDELIEDLDFDKYLTHQGTISSSGLKRILKSPQHYLAELCGHFKDDEDEEKDYFRFGRAAHMLILEPIKFKETYVVAPEFWGPTKDGKMSQQSAAAKEKREAWHKRLPPGANVLEKKEFDDLMYMLDSLCDHRQIRNLLKNGKPEVSGFFTDKETGIRIRIRPDYLTVDSQGRVYISDIKTTRDSSKGLFSSDIARMKYNMQLALYYDGIWQITGKEPEAAAYIPIEKKIPYPCALYWMDDDALDKGRQWYKYALKILKRCLTENDWPAAQTEGEIIELPKYTEFEAFPQFDWASDKNPNQQTEGV